MKRWKLNDSDKKIVSELMINGGLTSLTAALLNARGYKRMEDVMTKYEINELSDPFLIEDMEKAADKINEAIDDYKKICVYGDYDCDGIMATVMLYTFLLEIGADVVYYIPERSEGYGLNKNAIQKLSEDAVDLIITVDNGISAISEAELIYELGMELIITDHHQVGEILPKAEAVIDPHRKDCLSPYKYLCGAGVVLKLIAALDGGEYTMALEQFADLAAIATVADIVELTDENRYIVQTGLRMIKNTDRLGLLSLIEVSGLLDKEITSTSIAFGLAPRINASGRFGSPNIAVELFLCENDEDSLQIAEELNNLNLKRKETEMRIMKDINENINKNPQILRERIIFISGENWHHGVIGIVASKLQEMYGKPCFIMSNDNGEIRGSARSYGGVSIFEILNYSKDCLEKYGGHSGAGGFTVKTGMIDAFNEKIKEYTRTYYKEMPDLNINIDYILTPNEITVENIKGIYLLEPFGYGNESPIFLIKDAIVEDIISLSAGKHSKIRIRYGGKSFDTIIFGVSLNELGLTLGSICSLVVKLSVNTYKNNENVTIQIIDYICKGIEQNKVFSALKAYESFYRNEELPVNYYKSMYPTRDEVKIIYIKINENGINIDKLYSEICNLGINYCKMKIALDALNELNLIDLNYSISRAVRLKVNAKVDLNSAPILLKLKEKMKG